MGIHIAHAGAQIPENPQQQVHVADLRDVLDSARAAHHQGGGDNGNGRVLRAADMDLSKQGPAALNNISGQNLHLFVKIKAI